MANQFIYLKDGALSQGSKGQLMLNGLHSETGGQFITRDLIYDIQEGPTGLGDPITADAAIEMINKWQNTNHGIDEAYVDFGKETLLLLLSQAGCEGVRFYFCKNHADNISLILTGYDKDLREINGENIGDFDKKQPLLVEVGGGCKQAEITIDIKTDEPKCLLYKYYDTKKNNSNGTLMP